MKKLSLIFIISLIAVMFGCEQQDIEEARGRLGQSCNRGVYNGDFTIKTSMDLKRLSGYTEITGDLNIGSIAGTSITNLDSAYNYFHWLFGFLLCRI